MCSARFFNSAQRCRRTRAGLAGERPDGLDEQRGRETHTSAENAAPFYTFLVRLSFLCLGRRCMEEESVTGGALFGYSFLCIFLVLFGGLMSGLTLGLMSLTAVELEVRCHRGSRQRKQGSFLTSCFVENAGAHSQRKQR